MRAHLSSYDNEIMVIFTDSDNDRRILERVKDEMLTQAKFIIGNDPQLALDYISGALDIAKSLTEQVEKMEVSE